MTFTHFTESFVRMPSSGAARQENTDMTSRSTRQLIGTVIALVALVTMVARAQQSARELFERARLLEENGRNLNRAVALYEQVVAQAKTDRALAAAAHLRIGIVRERQGNPEARALFATIVRDYSDQPTVVATARERLAVTQDDTAALTTRRVLDRGAPWDRISPDGRFLARVDHSTENLVLHELATGKVRPLTSDGNATEPDHRYPLTPVFSRDGRQIVYQWFLEKEDRAMLRVVSTADGAAGNPRAVYDNPDATIAPTDWSPDGKWIAGVVRRNDHIAQIGLVNVADGSLRVLKTVDWSRVGGLRFSPDSSLLAYHRPETDGAFARDVFVIAVDGSREFVAAQSPGDDIVLEWTPDGRRLLVASDRGGSMSVWSVAASAQPGPSSFELVKSDIGIINSLGPTRDGTLFYNLLPTGSVIYVAKFDTSSGQLSTPPVQPVQQFRGWNTSPEWSGDGAYLAFSSRRDVPAPINVTRVAVPILSMATGRIERELHPALSYGERFRWSPDGQRFIVRGADLKGRSGILRVEANTGDVTLLLQNDTCSGMPYWSPDSKSIFCHATPDWQSSQQSEIVQVDATAGTVLRRYPAEGQGFGVSPDGRYIVYRVWPDPTRNGLRLLTLENRETREILRLPPPASQILNERSIAWTPDSRAVTFSGTINGDQGMWLVPIDGRAPHKIALPGVRDPVIDWRINAKTGQVAFTAGDANGGRLEVWKMEHFLPALSAKK